MRETLPPWCPQPLDLQVSTDEIHIWRLLISDVEVATRRVLAVLTPSERDRATHLAIPAARQEFIVGRAVLRHVLGNYLDCRPADVPLGRGPHGKPGLLGGHPDIRFNVSHSHGLVLYGVARGREVGVDVERIRPVPDGRQLAERFFSRREARELSQLPATEFATGFFNCWTRKEAYAKATGFGLALPLDSFEVSLAPGTPATLALLDVAAPQKRSWDIRAIPLGDAYVGAVVSEGTGWRVKHYEWNMAPLTDHHSGR